MEQDTCTDIARRLDEPLGGTGPAAVGWLLLEHAGAWPRTAIDALDGEDPATDAVRRAAATPGVKVLLIRRPRHPWAATVGQVARTAFLVHAGSSPWCEELDPRSDAFGDLDASVLLGAQPPRLGAARTSPLFLVCTHAKRDRCCASLGRPIADTLRALHPEDTWECSHLGGHRFAGNLLTLPDGFAYGNLDVAAALEVVTSTLAGRVHTDHLRGRVGLARPAQAADAWSRRTLGISSPRGVRIVDEVDVADAPPAVIVTVEIDGAAHQLRVEHRPSRLPRRMSCDAEDVEDPGEFVVTG